MQVGQRLGIIERAHFGQDGGQQLQCPIGLGDEGRQLGMHIGDDRLRLGALVEEAFGAARGVGRRQIEKGEKVAALVVCAFGLEGGAALLVDQPRRGIGEAARRIAVGSDALGFEEQGPAVAEAFQRIVESRRDSDQLGLGGAVEVGAPVAQCALEASVLVQDDAGRHQARPWQVVGQVLVAAAVLGEAQHDSAPL